jgi:hypothetical protein
MNDKERSRIDALFDLLADEVADRLEERAERRQAVPVPSPRDTPPVLTQPAEPVPEITPESETSSPALSHAAVSLARLAIGILIVVVLINIPYNSQGLALARSIPNSASLILADGLLVKESDSTDIYVYRNSAFHWVTSLDAFKQLGYRWDNVHIVEPGYLAPVAKGNPIYILLKCSSSPHIYRLEADHKRWIVDIATFTAEGYVWEDIKFVGCDYLRTLPDGDSIPPGHGTPSSELP